MPSEDPSLGWINSVLHPPWIGPHFGADPKRLLILGESFYTKNGEPAPREINTILVTAVAHSTLDPDARKTWGRHFSKISALFADGARDNFWQRVAYYNYVQASVGIGPRLRPTAAMWHAAVEPLKTTLLLLSPKRVLVLGFTLFGELIRAGLVNDEQAKFPRFKLHEKDNPVLRVVAHPASRGFRKEIYQPTVAELCNWTESE
jgi:hypothetical protein